MAPVQQRTGREKVSEQPKKWRPGFFSYLALVMVIVVVMLGGSYVAWYVSAKNALERARQEIVGRGEPYWFADLAPEPVDPEMDGTPFLLKACSLLTLDKAFYERLDGTAMGSAQPTPAGPGDYPEFRKALAENQPALAVLREAIQFPHCRMPVNYKTYGQSGIYPDEMQKARTFSELLGADVLQSLGTGKPRRAVEAVHENLALSELLRDEPLLISQFVRIAIAGVSLHSLQTTVGHADLTPTQFTTLDNQLAQIESNFTLKPAMIGERCLRTTTMANVSAGDAESLNDLDAGSLGGLYTVFKPLVMEEQVYVLEITSRMAAAIDVTGPKGQQLFDDIDHDINNTPKRFLLAQWMLSDVSPYRASGLHYRQKLACARLGLRVDRYRAEHGKLPASLEEVLDEKLKEVPAGVFSAKPLVYKVGPDGFSIYGLGTNGVDDGGDVTVDNQERGAFTVTYPD